LFLAGYLLSGNPLLCCQFLGGLWIVTGQSAGFRDKRALACEPLSKAATSSRFDHLAARVKHSGYISTTGAGV
jgi:hypothetical protein